MSGGPSRKQGAGLSLLRAPLGSPSYSPVRLGTDILVTAGGAVPARWQPPLISPLRGPSLGYVRASGCHTLGSGVSSRQAGKSSEDK